MTQPKESPEEAQKKIEEWFRKKGPRLREKGKRKRKGKKRSEAENVRWGLLGLVGFVAIVVFLVWQSGSVTTGNNRGRSIGSEPTLVVKGGTLHKSGILEWQNASHANKLATCVDILAGLLEKGTLKIKVASPEEFSFYTQELFECIEAASDKHSDPKQNEMMYANQTVAGFASACLVLMGWVK